MKQEEANTILHKMSKVIDNNQMVKLNSVLEEIMLDNKLDSQLKSSSEILDAFIASKRLEGRSEKTLSLYRLLSRRCWRRLTRISVRLQRKISVITLPIIARNMV